MIKSKRGGHWIGETVSISASNDKPRRTEMAIYDREHGFQSILNASLGEYRSAGFRLVEDGDHFLKLYYKDSILGVFNQNTATIPAIHETCRRYAEMSSAS